MLEDHYRVDSVWFEDRPFMGHGGLSEREGTYEGGHFGREKKRDIFNLTHGDNFGSVSKLHGGIINIRGTKIFGEDERYNAHICKGWGQPLVYITPFCYTPNYGWGFDRPPYNICLILKNDATEGSPEARADTTAKFLCGKRRPAQRYEKATGLQTWEGTQRATTIC